jgi:hypothetical protein
MAGTVEDRFTRASGVARFNPDGTPDVAFGDDGTGRVTVDFTGPTGSPREDVAGGMALQADGGIVLVGSTYDFYASTDYDFALARFQGDAIPNRPPTARRPPVTTRWPAPRTPRWSSTPRRYSRTTPIRTQGRCSGSPPSPRRPTPTAP